MKHKKQLTHWFKMNKNKFVEAPHSKESEMIVLGCMLSRHSSLKIAIERLVDFDFYFSEHKEIFQSLKTVFEGGKPGDIHIVSQILKQSGKLDAIGGVGYLMSLTQYAGTSAHIEEYCAVVEEKSKLRQQIELARKIEKMALENAGSSMISEEIFEIAKRIEKRKSLSDRFPIQFIEDRQPHFLFETPPQKPMLLEYADSSGKSVGFLPKGIVGMLVGAGGVGKSHLLSQLAISIATGTPWLGTFTPTRFCGEEKRGTVFLGLGENQYEDIHRLLNKACKHFSNKTDEGIAVLREASRRIAPFSFCGQQAAFIEERKPSRYFRELKMRLEDLAPADGWSLIILDPVSRLLGADAETDNAAATQFIALLEELTIDLPGNPTVLFAHHVNKSAIQQDKQDQSAARGSSALTDGVRWQINSMKKTNDITVLKMTKSNFTKIIEEINLTKDFEGFIEQVASSEISSRNISY